MKVKLLAVSALAVCIAVIVLVLSVATACCPWCKPTTVPSTLTPEPSPQVVTTPSPSITNIPESKAKISGYLYSAETQLPLAGVTLTLYAKPNLWGTARSDAQGYYEFVFNSPPPSFFTPGTITTSGTITQPWAGAAFTVMYSETDYNNKKNMHQLVYIYENRKTDWGWQQGGLKKLELHQWFVLQPPKDQPLSAEIDPSKTPLVFVHGHGGTAGTWRAVRTTLDPLGYQTWEVHYGTSDPIVECAAVVSDAVQTVLVLGRYAGDKVDMVTHSQGGAVSRAYVTGIARYPSASAVIPYSSKVRKLLQLAPPNSGILNGYRVEYKLQDTLCDKAVSYALEALDMLDADEPVAADLSLASTFLAELSHRPWPSELEGMLIVAGTDSPIPPLIQPCPEAVLQNDLAVGASSSSLLNEGIPLGLIHLAHTPICQTPPVADVISAFLASDVDTLKRSLDVYIDPGITFDDPQSWRVSIKGAEHDAFPPHYWDDRQGDTDFASGGLWLRIEDTDGTLLVSGTVTARDERLVSFPGLSYWPMHRNPESGLWLVDSNLLGFVLPVDTHFEYPYVIVAADGPTPTKLGYVCIKPMQVISTTLSMGNDPPTICQVEESADPINVGGCPAPNHVTVRAFAADDVEVNTVQLYFQPPGDSSWIPKEMSLESGSIYSVTIGPFSSKGALRYYIKARDSAGKETQSVTGTVTVACTAPNGLDVDQLEPGDILMVNASPPVSLLLSLYGGYWGHTAIYAGEQKIIEATTNGVMETPIEESGFWTADDWVVKRANTTSLWKTAAVALAQLQVGKPYNTELRNKWTMDSYYSSQLVWRAYCGSDAICQIDLDTNWTAERCKEVFVFSALCNGLVDPVLPDDIYHDDEHLTEVQARQWDAKRVVVSLGSPADLYITDPFGRHVGVDPETNEVRQEIPEVSYYSGRDAEPEYVVITNMEGDWTVQVIGTGTGTYTLATEVVGLGDRARSDYVTGGTAAGQRDHYTLTYPETLGSPIRIDDTPVCPTAEPAQGPPGPSPAPTGAGTLRLTALADSALGANLRASAAAWGDYDGDGDLDLYVGMVNLPSRLYRNNRDGTFTDVARPAGLPDSSGARGAAFADVDNDGDLDLIVAYECAPARVYHNNGDTTFTDASSTSGLGSFSAVAPLFADYDNDGYLDLYLTASVCDALYHDALYHNDGDGTFTDVTREAELHSCCNSLGAAWADYDDDGDQDLYVAKSGGQPDVLFRNNGDGTFTDVAAELGLADAGGGVAVAWGDYDNDGDLDLYLTNYGRQPSALYRNNGGRTFTNVADEARVDYVGAGRSALFADLDNDRYLDLYVVSCPANVVYRNNGDGTFTDVTPTWGGGDERCGQGAAAGDYNGDGYLDLFVLNNAGPSRLYRNTGGANHWLVIKTEGTGTKHDVIGARVSVCACGRLQTREVGAGAGWPSMGNLPVEFGLGSCPIADQVQVRWPSKARQRLASIEVDRLLVITEPTPGEQDAPITDLTATNDGPRRIGQLVTFAATVTTGSNVNYAWSFGDGGTAEGRVVTHAYAEGGTYTATVTASNSVSTMLAETTATSVALSVRAGRNQSAQEGGLVLIEATFSDSHERVTHTATIDWGDGTPPTAGTVDEAASTIRGRHAYGDNGTYTVTVTVDAGGGNTASDTLRVTVSNRAPEVSAKPTSRTVQYGHAIAPITFTARDAEQDTMTAALTDGPVDLALVIPRCRTVSGVHTCTWEVTGSANVIPGTYTLTLTVTDKDGDSGYADAAVTIERAHASVLFGDENPVAIKIAVSDERSGPFPLRVCVRDPDPTTIGDISQAQVSMTLVPVGPGDSLAGAADTTTVADGRKCVTFGFADVPVNVYSVQVEVGGSYYTGGGEDVLVVYRPSMASISGGGWFYWPETANDQTGYRGDRTNFGYTMKDTDSGITQGNLLLIRRTEDGRIYRVKSSAVIRREPGEDTQIPPGGARLTGESTYLEPGWPEPKVLEFTVYVEDGNEPGDRVDRFWIQVVGGLSLRRPDTVYALPIASGNIVVPH